MLTLKVIDMDTLYLVFKDRFQNVFGFALQTTKTLLKQTETLTDALYSVKRRQVFGNCYFFRQKSRLSPSVS